MSGIFLWTQCYMVTIYCLQNTEPKDQIKGGINVFWKLQEWVLETKNLQLDPSVSEAQISICCTLIFNMTYLTLVFHISKLHYALQFTCKTLVYNTSSFRCTLFSSPGEVVFIFTSLFEWKLKKKTMNKTKRKINAVTKKKKTHQIIRNL